MSRWWNIETVGQTNILLSIFNDIYFHVTVDIFPYIFNCFKHCITFAWYTFVFFIISDRVAPRGGLVPSAPSKSARWGVENAIQSLGRMSREDVFFAPRYASATSCTSRGAGSSPSRSSGPAGRRPWSGREKINDRCTFSRRPCLKRL